MNRLRLLAGLVLFLSMTVSGQDTKLSSFDLAEFNKNVFVAEWLFQYDQIAWRTSDIVMKQSRAEIKRLGGEWFCFQAPDKKWHAIYGKYSKNKFDQVFHYVVNSAFKITRVYTRIDTTIVNSYSRALITANKEIKSIKDSARIMFNQYIRKNDDKTFTVWIFPAFQPNRNAVFGGEFIFTIDQHGNQILKNNSYFLGGFKAFKVDKPRPIRIEYKETEKPTLGSIFYAWYYKKYFTDIMIVNKNHMSALVKEDNGTYSWMHLEKPSENVK